MVNKVIPNSNVSYDDIKSLQTEYMGLIHESDVNALDRFLWTVKPKFSKNIRKCYIDIEILRDSTGQYCSVVDAKNKIASITIYDSFMKKYFIFLLADEKKSMKKDDRNIYIFNSEKALLNGFLKVIEVLNPDVFTGWNVMGFDMPYLINRMENLGLDNKRLSPLSNVYIKAKMFKEYLSFRINIKGRGIMDLMDISKQFWMGTDVGYSLEAISQKFLGMGKIEIGDIDRVYKNDFWKFVDYNVRDVELCILLDEKTSLIEYMQSFQDIISINLDETPVAGRIINSYIKQHTNIVLTDAFKKEIRKIPGGYVHKVSKGIFKNIHKFDFASHYPSIIRTYNISPDTIVYNPKECDKPNLIHFKCKYHYVSEKGTTGFRIILDNEKVPSDAIDFEVWFRKDIRGAISGITDVLLPQRLEYKAAGNKSLATVLKRMANSIFGQLCYQHSRFFNIDCAMAITLIGQWLTKSVINDIEVNNKGTVVMGDTDSFAIKMLNNSIADDIILSSEKIFKLSKALHNLENVYSKLELEAVIDKMILFGVKKKYAQLINGKTKVQGLEMIRKDFPEALKDFQKRMINEIFTNDNVSMKDYKRIKSDIMLEIKSCISRKKYLYFSIPTIIRKALSEYVTNTAEKKAIRNSGLVIPTNETFYILPCTGNRDMAFKNVEELENLRFVVDEQSVNNKIFGNAKIFEDLFYEQKTLFSY